MIGSSSAYDWEEEFNKFKGSKNSEIRWEQQINHYRDCVKSNRYALQYTSRFVNCSITNRESVIESTIRKMFKQGANKCIIFFKPFERENGKVEIGTLLSSTNYEVTILSKTFRGPLANSSKTYNQLTKYLRVNKLKLTSKHWIEVSKSNQDSDYSAWEFEYNIEYKS